jgi:hypothetical protein
VYHENNLSWVYTNINSSIEWPELKLIIYTNITWKNHFFTAWVHHIKWSTHCWLFIQLWYKWWCMLRPSKLTIVFIQCSFQLSTCVCSICNFYSFPLISPTYQQTDSDINENQSSKWKFELLVQIKFLNLLYIYI